MPRRIAGTCAFALIACATSSPPEAPVTPAPPSTFTPMPTPATTSTFAPPPAVTPASTFAPPSTCGPQPEAPPASTEPTCTTVTIADGQHWEQQLTLKLSSGAFTRIDCPRMRMYGQDAPLCVTKQSGGRLRGACCPPGHTDPLDPACVSEGSIDAMYRRMRAWEWCDKDKPQSRPCEPCVWYPGAQRK